MISTHHPLLLVITLLVAGPTITGPAQAEKERAAPKTIYVVTDEQKLYAWEGNELVYEFHIVSGRPGKETHAGIFSVSRKYEDYTSKTYNAPMPYSMFFTNDGKAIHGTQYATARSFLHAYVTESVGSHGCVGLTEDNARTLFEWAPMHTRIVVLEEEPDE